MKNPPEEFVNVKRQTIYSLIPYVQIWAFYRIQKLKMFILISLGIGFAFTPIQKIMFSGIDISSTNSWDPYSEPLVWMYLFAMMLCIHTLSAFFIRRWSIKWNERLESGIESSEKIKTPTFVESRWKKPNIYITIPSISLFVATGILGLATIMMYYDSYLMATTFTIPAIVVSITSAIGAIKLWNRKKSGVTISMISLGSLTIVLPMNVFFATGLVLHLDYGFEVSSSIVIIPIVLSIVMMLFLSIAKKQILWNEQFSESTITDETK